MFTGSQYGCDTEFFKLMMRHADVDLTLVALELARDAYPGLDFQPTLDWIDARAAELSGAVARADSDLCLLQEIAECLSGEHGICGDRESYDRPESSYLHRVIETRRGIPISLSVVYMAVAERLGVELRGVAAPLHFLTRFDSPRGPLFVDAFGRGRVLNYGECLGWLERISRMPKERLALSLEPVGPRPIIIRMLNNLKALYVRLENWTAAWHVQHRLAALQPASYPERRDLALISLRANRPGTAIDLLQCCLKTCPSDDRELLECQLREARGQIHRWN